jgi:hypothetical protein
MRYQERIYIQNENRGVRNKDILNVNMSSDFCIFQSPTFDISGATKVQCNSIECNLSGVSLSNIITATTNTCIGTGTTDCISQVTWVNKIYEDGNLTLSNQFFTADTVTAYPSDVQFLASITQSFNDLSFSFTKNGYLYTIDKPYGIKSLEIELCISLYGTEKIFSCPIGYSATPANDGCVQIISTAATFNGSGATIVAGNDNSVYSLDGAFFYPLIQYNEALPVSYAFLPGSPLQDQSGSTISPEIVNSTNPFWASLGSTFDGRLNNIGLSASSTEWLGFTYCLDILSGGTYYIGLAADNFCRFSIDSVLLVNLTGLTGANFRNWSVFPYEFTSGRHLIELEGLNNGGASAFGAEIYNPIDFATLTGATSSGSTQANVIFSTSDFIGKYWEIGSTIGYSCPIDFILDGCGTAYTCTQINTTGITVTCTGECLDNCTIICNEDFQYIDNTSNGVYVLPQSATTLPLSFYFTGNTNSLSANNTSFKYEIYQYYSDLNMFKLPALYTSNLFDYVSFSGTNTITQSIPLDSLLLDGEYIVKGYFESNACTTFLNKLGKKIDTSDYVLGGDYGIYNKQNDFYFVAISEAEVPKFNNILDIEASYSPISLSQQVIVVDFSLENENSTNINSPSNLYQRTGSTFALTSEYVGDIIVTLNGLTLAKNIDYTLTGQVLTFLGVIKNEDIITIFYSKTLSNTLISESILINNPIISGTTNSEGTNRAFYNTITKKYEVYTNNTPLNNTKILIMLNGVTLADGIDYYQSTTNLKRIILVGTLGIDDIITIVYYPNVSLINGITQTNNIVSWYVLNGPQLKNGSFILEYSTASTFSTPMIVNTLNYEINQTNYSTILTLTGDVGTKYYYRVKNIKNYESICGDKIESIAYSEIVPIIIQTNSINSY